MFLPFCHNTRVWRMNRWTEFSSLDRVCIACSAVKTAKINVKKTSQFITQCEGKILSHAFKQQNYCVWPHDVQKSRCAFTRWAADTNEPIEDQLTFSRPTCYSRLADITCTTKLIDTAAHFCCIKGVSYMSSVHCVTLTFAEWIRLAPSLSGNKPLSAN